MALVQLPTVEESITALVKLHNFQLSETSHLRFSLLQPFFLILSTPSFSGSPSRKAQSKGHTHRRRRGAWEYVNARTNCAFLKLSVLSAISKYYNTGFMQFLGVYINLFLGPSWSFSLPWGPYMPSTYLFQSPPKIHQETVGFVNFEFTLVNQSGGKIFESCQTSWKICDTTKLKMIM